MWIDLLVIQTKCVRVLILSFRHTAQAAFMLLYNIRGVMAEWLERLVMVQKVAVSSEFEAGLRHATT